MFDADPKARADLRAGTLYAIAGESAWIYYGQVTLDKAIGFFRRREHNLAGPEGVLSSNVMTTVVVAHPSIHRPSIEVRSMEESGPFPAAQRAAKDTLFSSVAGRNVERNGMGRRQAEP